MSHAITLFLRWIHGSNPVVNEQIHPYLPNYHFFYQSNGDTVLRLAQKKIAFQNSKRNLSCVEIQKPNESSLLSGS